MEAAGYRQERTQAMTDQSTAKKNMQAWKELQAILNKGDFEAMDQFFHPDFEYSNHSRPDLTGYAAWKQSPMTSYRTFQPSHYSVVRMADRKSTRLNSSP